MGLLDLYYASQAQLTILDPDLVTQYPATITGTPNASQNPGGPPRNFDQPYTSNDTYLAVVAANLTRLQATLPITNFDVEDPGVQGGPISDTTTVYSPLVTGPPNITQNTSLTAPFSSGVAAKRFVQPWLPNLTYLTRNPIATQNSGLLYNTLSVTNLDNFDSRVNDNWSDTVTNYPPSWVTGTPNIFQNPGASPKRFSTKWFPFNGGYAGNNPIAGANSGIQYNIDPNGYDSLKITNLDTTEPGVQGGIPYNQLNDPTIYPPDTNHTEGNRGWFATPASASSKFYQNYNAVSTYSDFIQAYI